VGALIPPILLVRLKSHQPDGTTLGERERKCHLVPVRECREVPMVLRAYCGAPIPPDGADLLSAVTGMPCEQCLARAPIPPFGMLHTPLTGATDPAAGSDQPEDHTVVGWWDLALRPEQQLNARLVLLVLLQDPVLHRPATEVALRLGQDAHTVHLVFQLHAAIGWVELAPGQTDRPWAECGYRLTGHGAMSARRLLARSMTATFTDLAARLELDTSVLAGVDEQTRTDNDGGATT